MMVGVTTFDLWLQQHPRLQPTLLKVDIEGHEQAFFEGARHSLKLCRPFIIVELLQPSNFGYFANFLHDNLYQDIALCPGVARLLNEPHFIADAWNHLFCPQERVWEMACLCNLIGLPIG